MAYDLYLFDFDGVVFNTNRIKSDAFRQSLDGYPTEQVAAFVRYHEATGGISRYIKFAHFFEDMMGMADSAAEQAEAIERFGQINEALMAKASTLPGVLDFLTQIQRADKPAAVLSGGKADEIINLLTARDYLVFFQNIWGNERSKAEHAADTITGQFDKVLFFGDARYDMEVAEQFGFDFVFVASLTDWPEGRRIAAERGHRVIDDFTSADLSAIAGLEI